MNRQGLGPPLRVPVGMTFTPQGSATFANSRRSTLGFHRNVPLALKKPERNLVQFNSIA